MNPSSVNPILNVSDFDASVAWFRSVGWENNFRWGEPTTTFGSVSSGEVEIFLCLDGQGGKGKGSNATTFDTPENQRADKGCWMSLWVEDVDAVHQLCIENNIDITQVPEDMPWNVREMHIRHPDGHVFRIGSYVERT